MTALLLVTGWFVGFWTREALLWCAGKWMARGAGTDGSASGASTTVPNVEATAKMTPRHPQKASPVPAPILHIDAASDAEAVDALLHEVNR